MVTTWMKPMKRSMKRTKYEKHQELAPFVIYRNTAAVKDDATDEEQIERMMCFLFFPSLSGRDSASYKARRLPVRRDSGMKAK